MKLEDKLKELNGSGYACDYFEANPHIVLINCIKDGVHDYLTRENEFMGYAFKDDFDTIEFKTKKECNVEELDAAMSGFADVFNDTMDFQRKYELHDGNHSPHFIEDSQVKVKIGHLHEELAEIEKAHSEGNIVEFADGIIDLIYVAAGLGALCSLPMDQLWNDVQNSNMIGKERVKSLAEATKRGSTFDVRKGPDWIGPRGAELIDYADKVIQK